MPSRLFLRAVSLTLAPEPIVSFLEKSLMCCLRQQGTRKRVRIILLQLERNVMLMNLTSTKYLCNLLHLTVTKNKEISEISFLDQF